MNELQNSTQGSDVLFWEAVLDIELGKVSAMLEQKQSRLATLRNLPFNEKSEASNRTMKALEAELSAFVGLIGVVEQLRCAYVNFSASVADKLVMLASQRDFYKAELLELMAEGGAYRP